MDVNWRWGTAVIGGFLLPGVIDALVGLVMMLTGHGSDADADADAAAAPATRTTTSTTAADTDPTCDAKADPEKGAQMGEIIDGREHHRSPKEGVVAKVVDEEAEQMRGVHRVRAAVLLGDFMHNLVDGFFIGAAFRYYGTSFGWSMTGMTVVHELAQARNHMCKPCNPCV